MLLLALMLMPKTAATLALAAKLSSMSASYGWCLGLGREIEQFPVRELAEIRMVKHPVWRDIKL
nr:hypothetical protein REQ54_04164 [Rhizobium sp. Q54]